MGKKRKFSESFVYVLIVAFIINSLATGIIGYNIDEIISNKLSINSQLSTIISDYLVYTIPLIIILLIAMSIKRNRYMLNKFSIKNNKLLLGVGIGLLMNSFCVLVAYIHKDITLTWNYINIILLLFCFLAVLIQCLAEEMLNRIFIFEKIKKSYNSPLLAIVINSLFFGLIHIFNDGISILAIVSIISMGVLTSLMIYYYDNIWGAVGIHTAWNFTQNIIFGLLNSGNPSAYSIFKMVDSRNSFAYNTYFGIEATWIAILTILLVSIILYLYNSKHKMKGRI